ncbi:MAG TPA: hypothetical protein VFY23_16990 [Candidatus Limnocylindrales bacterium]|nr:hypothetical protein [Candidatus Limnocylindrales bacterium]
MPLVKNATSWKKVLEQLYTGKPKLYSALGCDSWWTPLARVTVFSTGGYVTEFFSPELLGALPDFGPAGIVEWTDENHTRPLPLP